MQWRNNGDDMYKRIEKKFNKLAGLDEEKEKLLKEVNLAFAEKFSNLDDDIQVFIMMQSGDDWCFVWGSDKNTPLFYMPSISECLKMSKEEFFEKLSENQI